jgi:Holliday junction resolvase RusA-like endonuclease
MILRFTITLPPKAQKRDRIGSRAGHGFSYKDKGQRLEEDKLITLMYQHRPPRPLEGPLILSVNAFLPIPQSKSKKWKAEALAGTVRPTTKPDCSNLVKNLEDVMNGVFFRDDCQLVGLGISKFYGEPARWEISLREVTF